MSTGWAVSSLIKAVKSHEFIYNSSSSEHSDRNLTRAAWLSIAEDLHLEKNDATCKMLRSRWKGLRSSLLRLEKAKPSSGCDATAKRRRCESWEHWADMEWLLDYVDISGAGTATSSVRVSSVSQPKSPRYDDESDDDVADSEDQENVPTPATVSKTPSCSSDDISRQSQVRALQEVVKKKKGEDPIASAILANLQQRANHQTSEEEAFAEHVALSLTGVADPEQREFAKLKIQEILVQAKLGCLPNPFSQQLIPTARVPSVLTEVPQCSSVTETGVYTELYNYLHDN